MIFHPAIRRNSIHKTFGTKFCLLYSIRWTEKLDIKKIRKIGHQKNGKLDSGKLDIEEKSGKFDTVKKIVHQAEIRYRGKFDTKNFFKKFIEIVFRGGFKGVDSKSSVKIDESR